jgi:transcriptional regulator with XRE-family HTH domain
MASRMRPREVDVHVGNRVRVARQARKMTQEGLAHKLGLTFQQVQKYENGKNRISAGRLHQIAIIMGVPITFFFEGVNAAGKIDPATTRAMRFLATRQGTLIADAFPRLEKRTQQAILDLIQAGGRR